MSAIVNFVTRKLLLVYYVLGLSLTPGKATSESLFQESFTVPEDARAGHQILDLKSFSQNLVYPLNFEITSINPSGLRNVLGKLLRSFQPKDESDYRCGLNDCTDHFRCYFCLTSNGTYQTTPNFQGSPGQSYVIYFRVSQVTTKEELFLKMQVKIASLCAYLDYQHANFRSTCAPVLQKREAKKVSGFVTTLRYSIKNVHERLAEARLHKNNMKTRPGRVKLTILGIQSDVNTKAYLVQEQVINLTFADTRVQLALRDSKSFPSLELYLEEEFDYVSLTDNAVELLNYDGKEFCRNLPCRRKYGEVKVEYELSKCVPPFHTAYQDCLTQPIVQNISDLRGMLGFQVTVTCHVEPSQGVEIIFNYYEDTFEEKIGNTDVTVHFENNQLFFTPLTLAHIGSYTCVAMASGMSGSSNPFKVIATNAYQYSFTLRIRNRKYNEALGREGPLFPALANAVSLSVSEVISRHFDVEAFFRVRSFSKVEPGILAKGFLFTGESNKNESLLNVYSQLNQFLAMTANISGFSNITTMQGDVTLKHNDICREERTVLSHGFTLQWPPTLYPETATIDCPFDAAIKVTRMCFKDREGIAFWGMYNAKPCDMAFTTSTVAITTSSSMVHATKTSTAMIPNTSNMLHQSSTSSPLVALKAESTSSLSTATLSQGIMSSKSSATTSPSASLAMSIDKTPVAPSPGSSILTNAMKTSSTPVALPPPMASTSTSIALSRTVTTSLTSPTRPVTVTSSFKSTAYSHITVTSEFSNQFTSHSKSPPTIPQSTDSSIFVSTPLSIKGLLKSLSSARAETATLPMEISSSLAPSTSMAVMMTPSLTPTEVTTETDRTLEKILNRIINKENLTRIEARNASQNLYKITKPSSQKAITPRGINDASLILNRLINNIASDPQVREHCMDAIDHLLQVDSAEIARAQEEYGSSSRILEVMGLYGQRLAQSLNGSYTTSRTKFALGAVKEDTSSYKGFVTALSQQNEKIALSLEGEEDSSQFSDSSIVLPKSLISEANIQSPQLIMVFTAFTDMALFPSDDVIKPSGESPILAAEIRGQNIQGLASPVEINFNSEEDKSDALCGFWDFSKGKGGWSTSGCYKARTEGGLVTCHCNHLTNFALLFGAKTSKLKEHKTALTILTYVGSGISILGATITFITYLIHPKLRDSHPPKILMNLVCTLILLYVVFLAGIEQTSSRDTCRAVAILLQYSFLAVFSWSMVEGFSSFRAIVRPMAQEIRKFIPKAMIVGWGLPLVLTAIGAGVWPDSYGSDESCVVGHLPLYITVLAPVGLILLLNYCALAGIMCSLTQSSRRYSHNAMSHRDRLRVIVAFILLFGLTWVFGLLVISNDILAFQYIFCVLSGLHGFFVFLFYCVRNENVRKAWVDTLCFRRSEVYVTSTFDTKKSDYHSESAT